MTDSVHSANAETKSVQAPLSADVMREEWYESGGDIHGPNVETVTMPERSYFKFRRALSGALNAAERQALLEVLAKDHDGSDFEPECPLCTAYKKLSTGAT